MDSVSNNGAAFANSQNVSLDTRQLRPNTPDAEKQERVRSELNANQVQAAEKDTQVNFSTADTNDREVSPELEQAVSELQEYVSQTNLTLAFSVDERTDRSVATLTDSESGDVVRQIPSEELLDIAAQIRQITSENGSAVGLLVNGKY